MFDWNNPPAVGGIVTLDGGGFRDPRGSIQNLLEVPCGTVALIKSKPNAVRSNHFHRTDSHLLFTIEGHWLYQECAVGENLNEAERIPVHNNETIWTPPMRLHRCTFVTPTTLISFSKLKRTHAEHEADLVRVVT